MFTSKSSTNNRKPIRSQRSRVNGAVHIFRYHSCCVPTNYNTARQPVVDPTWALYSPPAAPATGSRSQTHFARQTALRSPRGAAAAHRSRVLGQPISNVSQKCCRAKLGLRLGGCVGAHRLLTASFNLRNRTSRGLWPVRSRYIVKACGHPRQSATPNNASVGRASNIAWATDLRDRKRICLMLFCRLFQLCVVCSVSFDASFPCALLFPRRC